MQMASFDFVLCCLGTLVIVVVVHFTFVGKVLLTCPSSLSIIQGQELKLSPSFFIAVHELMQVTCVITLKVHSACFVFYQMVIVLILVSI